MTTKKQYVLIQTIVSPEYKIEAGTISRRLPENTGYVFMNKDGQSKIIFDRQNELLNDKNWFRQLV